MNGFHRADLLEETESYSITYQRGSDVSITKSVPPHAEGSSRASLRHEYRVAIHFATSSPTSFLTPRWVETENSVGMTFPLPTPIPDLILPLPMVRSKFPSPLLLEFWTSWVDLAMSLATSLQQIHEAGYFHRQINPTQIYLLSSKENQQKPHIWFSNLSMACGWREKVKNWLPAHKGVRIHGAGAYASPEHTGQVHGPIDHRSDLYSLGIIFYELVSGMRPTDGLDSEEAIAYAHRAIQFPRLYQVCSYRVPLVISHIITKLLHKNPQERYQSAMGLHHDLQEARKYLTLFADASLPPLASIASQVHAPSISEEEMMQGLVQLHQDQQEAKKSVRTPPLDLHFPVRLGSKDRTSVLRSLCQVYGREGEIQQILRLILPLLEKDSSPRPYAGVLIQGDSGIGKSCLVHMAVERLQALAGGKEKFHLIPIKFTPHSTAPFENLIHMITTMFQVITHSFSREEIQAQVLEPFGDEHITVLCQLFPVLRTYHDTEEDTPVETLHHSESAIRIRDVVCRFVHLLASLSSHVLIIFLDDVQWGMENSLCLLMELLSDFKSTPNLFYCLAMRTSDPQSSSVTLPLVTKKLSTQHLLLPMVLKPLTQEDVQGILADMTGTEMLDWTALSDCIVTWTQGNPFFVMQWIGSLYEEHRLYFQYEDQRWHTTLEEIPTLSRSRGLLPFLVEETKALDENALSLLQMASCLGSEFTVDALECLGCSTQEEIWEAFVEPLRRGWIYPVYELLSSSSALPPTTTASYHVTRFKFSHDKVHEAFSLSMAPSTRSALHYQIAMKLDGHDPFQQAHHLLQSMEHIQSVEVALQGIDMVFEAWTQASALSSHPQCLRYALFCQELLQRFYPDEETRWTTHYDRCAHVTRGLCESRAMLFHKEEIEKDLALAYRRITHPIKRLDIYTIHFHYLMSLQQITEAERLAQRVMNEYGCSMPATYDLQGFREESQQILHTPEGQNLQFKFSSLPLAQGESETEALLDFLFLVCPVFYILQNFTAWAYGLMLCCRLTIEKGLMRNSPVSITACAFAMHCILGPSQEIGELSIVGLNISERVQIRENSRAAAYMWAAVTNAGWNSLALVTTLIQSATYHAERTYDYSLMGYSHVDLMFFRTFYSVELNSFLADLRHQMDAVFVRHKTERVDIMVCLWESYEALSLLVDERPATPLYTHLASSTEIDQYPAIFALFIRYHQMIVYYYLDDPHALRLLDELEPMVQANMDGVVPFFDFYFFAAMVLVREATRHPHDEVLQQRTTTRLSKSLEKMRHFASIHPGHWKPRYLILQAEHLRRTQPSSLGALKWYQDARRGAEQERSLHVAALAGERAYELMVEEDLWGQQGCLEEVREAYMAWGAMAKVRRLTTRYQQEKANSSLSTSFEISLPQTVLHYISETVQRELDGSGHVLFFCETVFQLVGADQGVIVYQVGDTSYHLAQWSPTTPLQVHGLQQLATEHQFPLHSELEEEDIHTIQQVLHSTTPYNSTLTSPLPTRSGSTCCLPMKNGPSLVGALFLRNTLLHDAFPANQQTILELLCGHVTALMERSEQFQQMKVALSELQKRTDMLETMNKMKDEFVASTTHELRTPLNAVLGFSEILGETSLTEEQQNYCEMISGSAEGLLAVINDILDFQRCQQDNLQLSSSTFELRKCLDQEVLRLLVIRAGTVDLILNLDHQLSDRFCVEFDPLRLKQVLLNLLSNAVKFTNQGHILLSVNVETDDALVAQLSALAPSRPAMILRFSVQDTGIGIDPSKRSAMFKPFSQLDSGSKHKYMGTGLGLMISQNLVQLLSHQTSSISFESEVGVGTRFSFHLPVPALLPEANEEEMAKQRRLRSLKLLKNAVMVISIANPYTRSFFLREMQEVQTEWKYFPGSLEETFQRLQSLRPLHANAPLLCYLDMGARDEDDLLPDFIRRTHALGVHLFLLVNLNMRNIYQLMISPLHCPVTILPKPFYKDLVLNNSAATVQSAASLRDPSQPQASAVPPDMDEHRPLMKSSRRPSIDPVRMGSTILMVEDNKMNQRVQTRMLASRGWQCDIAENGAIGLQRYQERLSAGQPYQLILMDFHMPIMGGKEATLAMRAHERAGSHPHTHIVGLTAESGAIAEEGMCAILEKPMKKQQLHDMVARFLQMPHDCQCSAPLPMFLERENMTSTNNNRDVK